MAGPPSPLVPAFPVPATVVITPAASTLRTRWFPHRAEATYELVEADGRGGWRSEHWTATIQFQFVEVTNPEFALVNPIGLVISYLRLERAIGS